MALFIRVCEQEHLYFLHLAKHYIDGRIAIHRIVQTQERLFELRHRWFTVSLHEAREDLRRREVPEPSLAHPRCSRVVGAGDHILKRLREGKLYAIEPVAQLLPHLPLAFLNGELAVRAGHHRGLEEVAGVGGVRPWVVRDECLLFDCPEVRGEALVTMDRVGYLS